MAITFKHASRAKSLHFEDKAFLKKQVDKDALFQKRIKIIFAIAVAALLIGGATTCGLGFAVIIPYGLMHTACVSAGAGSVALGVYGIVMFHAGWDDSMISYFTKLPVCHKLLPLFQESLQSTRISDEKSWAYLLKCRKEYFEKRQEVIRTTLDTTLSVQDLQPFVLEY